MVEYFLFRLRRTVRFDIISAETRLMWTSLPCFWQKEAEWKLKHALLWRQGPCLNFNLSRKALSVSSSAAFLHKGVVWHSERWIRVWQESHRRASMPLHAHTEECQPCTYHTTHIWISILAVLNFLGFSQIFGHPRKFSTSKIQTRAVKAEGNWCAVIVSMLKSF